MSILFIAFMITITFVRASRLKIIHVLSFLIMIVASMNKKIYNIYILNKINRFLKFLAYNYTNNYYIDNKGKIKRYFSLFKSSINF